MTMDIYRNKLGQVDKIVARGDPDAPDVEHFKEPKLPEAVQQSMYGRLIKKFEEEENEIT